MADWSRQEVEAIVDDYLAMLASELSGTPYSKAARRRALRHTLSGRSEPAIEFKHANISAALLEAGFPYIDGYKPRANYQALLVEILSERLQGESSLHELAVADADRPIAIPEVDDILSVLTDRPPPNSDLPSVRETPAIRIRLTTN